MPDYSKYLLYTEASRNEFRAKHAADLEKNMQIFADWINGRELMTWTRFVRNGASEREIQFVVGILCCLYVERPQRCYFSFNQGAYMIRRDTATDEEWEQWCGRGKFGK